MKATHNERYEYDKWMKGSEKYLAQCEDIIAKAEEREANNKAGKGKALEGIFLEFEDLSGLAIA